MGKPEWDIDYGPLPLIPMPPGDCVRLILGIVWFSGMGWVLWFALNQ